MGLRQLVLVQPRLFPHEDAIARASGADDILREARVVPSLPQALENCSLVFGTSARDRSLPWPLVNPREAAQLCMGPGNSVGSGEIALVFGREHAGLTNEELQLCRYHVHIPAYEEFSSLNLAAAVQVLSYELRMAWLVLAERQTGMESVPHAETPASHDGLEQFYQHLQQTLVDIEFLDPEQPRHLMARLRRLYGRAQLSRTEVNILRGMLTETQKAARGELQQRRNNND